jgi:hypothetical protein
LFYTVVKLVLAIKCMRTKCRREHLDTRNRKWQEAVKWRNAGFIIYTFHTVLLLRQLCQQRRGGKGNGEIQNADIQSEVSREECTGRPRSKTMDSVRICTRSPTDAIVRPGWSGLSRFCAGRKWVHTWSPVCEYVRESSWSPSSSTLEPDRPQHDCPATCVIAQQYSFIAPSFQQGKNSMSFKSVIVCLLTYICNYGSPKLRDLKLCHSRSGCIRVARETEFDTVEWIGHAASRQNIFK